MVQFSVVSSALASQLLLGVIKLETNSGKMFKRGEEGAWKMVMFREESYGV